MLPVNFFEQQTERFKKYLKSLVSESELNKTVFYTSNLTFGKLMDILTFEKQNATNGFRLVEVQEVKTTEIIPVVKSMEILLEDDCLSFHKLLVEDKTGLYKLVFSDGNHVYFYRFYDNPFISDKLTGLCASNEFTWSAFSKYEHELAYKIRRPPSEGIFRISMENDNSLSYEKIRQFNQNELIIGNMDEIKGDIDYFFGNIDYFTSFNMPGIRKVLFVGEPGTGKTSICLKLATTYCNRMAVIFATEFHAASNFLSLAANFDIPSLLILEDADSSLERAESAVLNFLDGVDQPKNKHGAYLIMTTNFPERIAPRVKRAGRIDRNFFFAPFNGNDAISCARIYFQQLFTNFNEIAEKDSDALVKIFDKMTGAEIKSLAQTTAAYMVSQQIKKLSVETIRYVRRNTLENERKALLMEKRNKEAKSKIGFRNSDEDLPF